MNARQRRKAARHPQPRRYWTPRLKPAFWSFECPVCGPSQEFTSRKSEIIRLARRHAAGDHGARLFADEAPQESRP